MILSCERCHKVKVDDRWVSYVGIEADVVGICPTCLDWQKRIAAAKWNREGLELLERRAKGYGGPAEGEDIWKGFREP